MLYHATPSKNVILKEAGSSLKIIFNPLYNSCLQPGYFKAVYLFSYKYRLHIINTQLQITKNSGNKGGGKYGSSLVQTATLSIYQNALN